MIDVTVTRTGPLFNPAVTNAATEAMAREIKFEIAAQLLADWQMRLNQSIKHPTPYYETQVTMTEVPDGWLVHDRDIVYGPWLETGKSNRRTRFRGYTALRRSRQGITPKIPRLTRAALRRCVARLGG